MKRGGRWQLRARSARTDQPAPAHDRTAVSPCGRRRGQVSHRFHGSCCPNREPSPAAPVTPSPMMTRGCFGAPAGTPPWPAMLLMQGRGRGRAVCTGGWENEIRGGMIPRHTCRTDASVHAGSRTSPGGSAHARRQRCVRSYIYTGPWLRVVVVRAGGRRAREHRCRGSAERETLWGGTTALLQPHTSVA